MTPLNAYLYYPVVSELLRLLSEYNPSSSNFGATVTRSYVAKMKAAESVIVLAGTSIAG